MEVEAIEQLEDLKRMVDMTIEHLKSDCPMIYDRHPEPMAYDIILGGRFGIVDLQKRKG